LVLQSIARFFTGYAFISTLLGWSVALIIKAVYYHFKKGGVNFKKVIDAGGFPSSHSALVSAITMAIGLHEGFDSPVFAIALALTLIVTYDAIGVRQTAGDQARILNKILQEKSGSPEKLKISLGHTPVEMLAGVAVGVLTSIVLFLMGI
jgi:uncharacterized protein